MTDIPTTLLDISSHSSSSSSTNGHLSEPVILLVDDLGNLNQVTKSFYLAQQLASSIQQFHVKLTAAEIDQ